MKNIWPSYEESQFGGQESKTTCQMDLGFQVPQPLSKIGKLGSGDQVIIEILNHDTGKFNVLCRVSIVIQVGGRAARLTSSFSRQSARVL